jgi:hypothetical protein
VHEDSVDLQHSAQKTMLDRLHKILTFQEANLDRSGTMDVLGQVRKRVWVQIGGAKMQHVDLNVRVLRPRLNVTLPDKGDTINFGSVLTGRRCKTRLLYLSSTCGLDLNFQISLSHQDLFNIDVTEGEILAYSSQNINVGFCSQEDVQIHDACLTISSSVKDSGVHLVPITIPLKVISTTSWIDLGEFGPINFGKQFLIATNYRQLIGQKKSSKSFIIKNVHDSPVEYSVSFVGAHDDTYEHGPFSFQKENQMHGVVPIGEHMQIFVEFSPEETGRFDTQIVIAISVGKYKIDVSGECIKPEIALEIPSSMSSVRPAQDFIKDGVIHFGSIDTTMNTPISREYSVQNACRDSKMKLQVAIRACSEEAAQCFSLINDVMELEGGERGVFTILANPKSERVYQGSVEIRCVDNDTVLLHAALHCHGHLPKVMFLQDQFNCGKLPINEKKKFHVRVQNCGHTDINVIIKYSMVEVNSPELEHVQSVTIDGPTNIYVGAGEVQKIGYNIVGSRPCGFEGSIELFSETNQHRVISKCKVFGLQIKIPITQKMRTILSSELIPSLLPDSISNDDEDYLQRVRRFQDR